MHYNIKLEYESIADHRCYCVPSVRGYVDVGRLELAAEGVEQLEREHLQYDTELAQLREFTNSALATLGQQNGVELSSRLDTDIIAYNNVCARLLGKQHLLLFCKSSMRVCGD